MSGPFKLKYKNSAFPFKTDKEKISDDIGYDKEQDVFYDKDIQQSYRNRRGRFSDKNTKEYKKWLEQQKNIDKSV